MGGGGKLYPPRKERELLEVQQRSGDGNHLRSESNAASGVASGSTGSDDNEDNQGHRVDESGVRGQVLESDRRQHEFQSKLPATAARGNLKREYHRDNPAEEDPCSDPFYTNTNNNAISMGAKWDPIDSSSSRPSSPTNEVSLRSVASFPVKSIEEEEDPATISKTDLQQQPLTNPATLATYAQALRTSHTPSLEITPMQGDGNCLFRAISLQVYGSEDMHRTVRTQCLDFMECESQHFKHFIAQDYTQYIARKRCDGVHGNHTEIQAASELYNRRIEVYVPPKLEPMNIFQQEVEEGQDNGSGATLGTGARKPPHVLPAASTSTTSSNHPIRLLYMDGNHYDALIDPFLPTAGLGLGLPDLQPGLADKLQLDQAKAESNQIIQTNMEQKIKLALEESRRVQEEKEGEEMERVLRESCCAVVGKSGGGGNGNSRVEREEVEEALKKKAMYMSELDSADFDLEQAVSGRRS